MGGELVERGGKVFHLRADILSEDFADFVRAARSEFVNRVNEFLQGRRVNLLFGETFGKPIFGDSARKNFVEACGQLRKFLPKIFHKQMMCDGVNQRAGNSDRRRDERRFDARKQIRDSCLEDFDVAAAQTERQAEERAQNAQAREKQLGICN